MKLDALVRTRYPKLVCAGTGFVALDVVVRGREGYPALVAAGGSCGNVLTALAYLGWTSFPIARLAEDPAAACLIEDAKRWGVRTELLWRSSGGKTPIVVERLWGRTDQRREHTFERICPECGDWYPRERPMVLGHVAELTAALPTIDVFYLDRVSPAALRLAQWAKLRGAAIVFEPSSIGDERLFTECLALASVLKYSDQRLGGLESLSSGIQVPLEVETRGPAGLRYRLGTGSRRTWVTCKPEPIHDLVDTAGAGDWCSVGLIHALTRKGQWNSLTSERVAAAVRFGQKLAALNCRFEGARGAMYQLSKREFARAVSGSNPGLDALTLRPSGPPPLLDTLKTLCGGCLARSVPVADRSAYARSFPAAIECVSPGEPAMVAAR